MEVDTDILFPALVESVSVSVALGPDNIFPGEDKVFEVYLGAALGVFVSPIAYANVTIIDPDPNIPGEQHNVHMCRNTHLYKKRNLVYR